MLNFTSAQSKSYWFSNFHTGDLSVWKKQKFSRFWFCTRSSCGLAAEPKVKIQHYCAGGRKCGGLDGTWLCLCALVETDTIFSLCPQVKATVCKIISCAVMKKPAVLVFFFSGKIFNLDIVCTLSLVHWKKRKDFQDKRLSADGSNQLSSQKFKGGHG